MNRIFIVIVFLFLTITLSAKSYSKVKPQAEEKHYFGEKAPGLIPKLFDPKIVSPDGRFDSGSFTPDMKEFYFTRKHGKYKKRAFFVIRYENNTWGQESETDIRWPQFSADGNIMYLGKKYRERTNTGWSEPKSPGEFINEMAHGMSVSSNGTYYITVYKKGDNSEGGSIHYSRLIDGKYAPSVKINVGINSLTHDGKYLFFTRGEWKVKEDGTRKYIGKRYWVDIQVIESLRPKQ